MRERERLKYILKERPAYITFIDFKVIKSYRKFKSYRGYDISVAIDMGKHIQILKKWYWSHWILLVANSDRTKLAMIKENIFGVNPLLMRLNLHFLLAFSYQYISSCCIYLYIFIYSFISIVFCILTYFCEKDPRKFGTVNVRRTKLPVDFGLREPRKLRNLQHWLKYLD